jgi:exopolyphosphatase/guanosine-5'-triphosphate,3'-diphosphate pyrophosphatase
VYIGGGTSYSDRVAARRPLTIHDRDDAQPEARERARRAAPTFMSAFATLAAVDLGSNSFHCQLARVVGDQLYPLDALREPVRLAAGLTDDKLLDEAAQERALACLHRFGERLRGCDRRAVRAVATNTLRVAKNARPFLERAAAALGFPIEVIAGREEARLIYLGVAHSLPSTREKRLVVDVGGGSTELIIGTQLKPQKLESLFMGCVSYSLRHFPDGRLTKAAFRQAELAARSELQPVCAGYSRHHWSEAVGSSGTLRAIAQLLHASGYGDGSITRDGLERLRSALIRAGHTDALDGVRPDRAPVLPGGLAIVRAVMEELDIERMRVAGAAMRDGVLYDLLGRFHREDMREITVAQFMERYHVDALQARRVGAFAAALARSVRWGGDEAAEQRLRHLAWAAKLHEIGISVAYSGYHRHSAYIVEHADMPGFSQDEQALLAALVAAHRRSLKKIAARVEGRLDWCLVLALRLAVLFHRRRTTTGLTPPQLVCEGRRFRLAIDRRWLAQHPLTAAALREEAREWEKIGYDLRVPGLDALARDARAATAT